MSQTTDGAGARFVVNLVGMLGLVFGALPIVRYLLDLQLFAFTDAPYRWLGLTGGARYLPPAVVLAACILVAFVIERRAQRD